MFNTIRRFISFIMKFNEVEKILRNPKYNLNIKLHAYGTNIYGDWDNVMNAMKECHKILHNEHGIIRISSSLRLGTRTDRNQTIDDKIKSVEDKLPLHLK